MLVTWSTETKLYIPFLWVTTRASQSKRRPISTRMCKELAVKVAKKNRNLGVESTKITQNLILGIFTNDTPTAKICLMRHFDIINSV